MTKPPPKLSRKDLARVEGLVQASAVRLEATHDDAGELLALYISIRGELSRLPSSSNMKRVSRRRTKDGGISSFIMNNPEAQCRLAALTRLYDRARLELVGRDPRVPPDGLLLFGETPVHVQLNLAHMPFRHDSHNYAKPVCDWLQAVGVIQDDSRAQCWPLKKRDYGAKAEGATDIFVVRLAAVQAFCKGFVRDAIRSSGIGRGSRRREPAGEKSGGTPPPSDPR